MSDKIAILLNPSAGRGKVLREKERLEDCLKANGAVYNLSISKSEGDLIELAAKAVGDYQTIICVGGDTTFNLIANEILKAGKNNIFGMVGLGSSNEIVREFGLDTLESACSAIKEQQTKDMDVGCLTYDKRTDLLYFLGTASLGLGVTVNKYVEEFIRKHPYLSRSPFIDGILGAYNSFSTGKIPRRVRLEYNDESREIDFSLLVFNNTSYYAGNLKPSPSADPFDGLLNACIINVRSFIDGLRIYFDALRQKHITRENVTLLESKEFKLYSNGIEIQTDGKVRGPYKNIRLSIQQSALRVIVNPKKYEMKKG